MKIHMENSYGNTIIETSNNDLDIHELMQLFKQGALALGYHPDSVDRGFEAMAEGTAVNEYEDVTE